MKNSKVLGATVISKLDGARRAVMPRSVEPMKATLVDEPFSRSGWIFENKFDGVRAVCFIRNGTVRLVSRNQKDMTIKYPELEKMHEWIKAKEVVLDGEIVVLDKSGNADFQELQGRFGLTNLKEIAALRARQNVVIYVFDILYLDGFDLKKVPLIQRKTLLKKVLRTRQALQYAEHVVEEGEKLFRKAERARSEGIMAKNAMSLYEERRSNEWLKIKTSRRQEAVICGYTLPQGSREYFGALHLGLYRGKELISVGKVGTGFDRAKLKSIYEEMQPYRTSHHPFHGDPRKQTHWQNKDVVQWLKPKLVCEVRYSERTGEGSFRHPVFEGLRFDKKATECHYEEEHRSTREVTVAERKAATMRKRGRTTAKREVESDAPKARAKRKSPTTKPGKNAPTKARKISKAKPTKVVAKKSTAKRRSTTQRKTTSKA